MIVLIIVSNNSVLTRKDSFLALDEDGELAVRHPMKETSYYKQAMEEFYY